MLLLQANWKMAVMPAVTVVLLHHSAMDTGNHCNVVSTGKSGIFIYFDNVTFFDMNNRTHFSVVSTG